MANWIRIELAEALAQNKRRAQVEAKKEKAGVKAREETAIIMTVVLARGDRIEIRGKGMVVEKEVQQRSLVAGKGV